MDPSPWSPYKKSLSYLSCGSQPTSFILPPSPHEDYLTDYGVGNSNSMLLSSGQDFKLNSAIQPIEQPRLSNLHYEPLLTPPMHPSKETSDFFCETLFNGVSKENLPSLQNFIQASGTHSQNGNVSFPISENSVNGYGEQIPLPFHPSALDRPCPGPFGVLPHEAVMTRPNRYERNKDKFISPVSKAGSVTYNNGPYVDRDGNPVYAGSQPVCAVPQPTQPICAVPQPICAVPQPTQPVCAVPQPAQPACAGSQPAQPVCAGSQPAAFSGDSQASLSPLGNSVSPPSTSTYSSSPSDYYSSPQQNVGAYKNQQSPVPQSPSVAQQSYPPSPFANVDAVAHGPIAPPCSPMVGSPYMNNLNQVPQRSGLKPQPSPSSSVGSNSVMCYNTGQSQNNVHHGPVLPETSDYHSDFGVYGVHDHNASPSSFPSVYSPMQTGQMTMGNTSTISPRSHSQHLNSMPHDSRIPYGHPSLIQPPAMPSPTPPYLQNTMSHDTSYRTCSSSSVTPGQSMHLSRYSSCPTPMHSNLPTIMTSHVSNESFAYPPDMGDEKNALDMFNTHVDSGVHNPDNSSAITNFLDSELPILDPEMMNNGQLQLSETRESHQNSAMSMDNSNRVMTPHPAMLNVSHNNEMPQLSMNFYNSNLDVARPGNFTFSSYPRRRGRRGRRRKATVNHSNDYSRFQSFKNDPNAYNNGYSITSSNNLEYENTDCYNSCSKRICDMKELPPNYPLSRYRSELKMSDNQKKNSDKVKRTRRIYISIEEELSFLGELNFPEDEVSDAPQTFMKTRNKDTEAFLQCYKNFIATWKSKPDPDPEIPPKGELSKKEHRERHKSHRSEPAKPKLILRMGRCNKDHGEQWELKGSSLSPVIVFDSDESASSDAVGLLSSHKIKQEDEKCTKAKTGNSNKVFERLSKHGAKRKHRHSVDHSDKYNDLQETLHFTNYETLPAGKLKIKTEIVDDVPTTPPCTEQPNVPKKRGRKAKKTTSNQEPKKQTRRSSAKSSEPNIDFPVKIKQEPISDEEEVQIECPRRVLRSRKDDNMLKDPQPGPSIKKEPVDVSSDEVDVIDDSDSDPAWTPTAKQPKLLDHLKCIKSIPIESTAKKGRRKKGRRNSSGPGGPAGRKRKEKPVDPSPRKRASSEKPRSSAAARKKEKDKLVMANIKIKKEKPEYFVIAKSDIDKENPNIWRLDRDTNMLQRFDSFIDKAGTLLHRSTYTYAAWNEMCVHNYVKINVKIVSHSRVIFTVQYLGSDVVEAAMEYANMANDPDAPKRENFEVFLQSLISQALDPHFLMEIANENARDRRRRKRTTEARKIQENMQDEYFLSHIREIERVTEKKKQSLVTDTWDKELKKSAESYPCVNILDSITSEVQCQVCQVAKGLKLLQFYGQPYDYSNLGSVDAPLSIKSQFNVCHLCSTTVSLYNRLHHQKYNYFIECRTKLNQVKGDKVSATSHTLLDDCLQDHQWVNSMFGELEEIWRECDKKS